MADPRSNSFNVSALPWMSEPCHSATMAHEGVFLATFKISTAGNP